MDIKLELLNQCKSFVNKRLETVQEIISSNQNALQSETKSSAGDKHETGRAMLQLEVEKASQQLAGISQMNQVLSRINVSNNSENVHLGSVIYTDTMNYFLSISAGKLTVRNKIFYAVSASSPIGKMLLGKKVRDIFHFNNQKIKIILVE
jgi:transcription elongation GreA/GreB family factor